MFVVTGGAGFIGSNIIKELNNRGITNIMVVDNLKRSEKHKNLNPLHFEDFIDKEDFFNNLNSFRKSGIETIFHEGACSDTTESDGKYMMKNNYEYSKNLLNFSIENNINFIYASSASVYGDGRNGFYEDRKCENPLNIYAFSKFLFDQYIRNVIPRTKIQIVSLRYFNVYGPQENHKGRMASVIYKFHHQITESGKMKLFKGSGNFLRDFVYVDDIVKVNLFFLDNPQKRGIFNCGTGKAESFLKIAEIMRRLYKNATIEFIPFPEDLKNKYQTFTEANLTLLRKIGYKEEFTPLEKGIEKYVEILKTTGGYFTRF